jgi:hypothetical protein
MIFNQLLQISYLNITHFYNPPVKPYVRPPETLKEKMKREEIEEYMKNNLVINPIKNTTILQDIKETCTIL